ncbi:MAG: endopeptidase La [Anaerovoracaceae bacterium]|nr:endopeptidase La [Bacillota bacterium]MDY2670624.1 endopeptidase La [Anaerovoracaceae bacterium]
MADNEKNLSDAPENEAMMDSQITPLHGEITDTEDIEDLVHIVEDDDDGLPVIPLRGVTIFPTMLLHFDVGREKSISALENAMMNDQKVFLITQKNAETDLPTEEDFYEVGTTAHIKQMLRLPGNSIRVLAEGISRGRIEHMIHEVPFFKARIETLRDVVREEDEIRVTALRRVVLEQFREYLNYSQKVSSEIYPGIEAIEDSGRMADIITSHLDISMDDKEAVLSCIDVRDRLERVSDIILKEIEVTKIESEIAEKVRSNISESQKEYFLREQIRTIQQELGQDETLDEEVEKWLAKLEELDLDQPVHDKIEKEIKRVRKLQPQSPDVSVMRTYIELVLGLPWHESTRDRLDLKKMQKILDEDHYGLEKVKERIIEYMAVRILSKDFKGHILCLVGPPGVGKTSIARSVARSMNRKFVRMSLGGVRDEAEIRGHRRTYVGAIPGRIISSINDAGVNNPVFLLDEIDKVGSDYRGDPASALLEALDPEQNSDFKDHYLDVPFDLSHVLFITTANTTDTIPGPLLDRMDIIQLASYTLEEKVKIAEQHLVPKQIKENGLKASQITFSEGAVRGMINYYTREAGVRNLERTIGKICRKAARKIVEGGASEKKKNHRITAGNLTSYLGKKLADYDKIEPGSEVGVTTGMAWTAVGGVTLFIETGVMHGTGKLMLTGQMGDVMQESAKIALSVIRERSDKLGLPSDFYEKNDIHIHIPEGATPKDGPSAGVTMCTSMVSALTNTPARREVAMTGEITLRGKVLPIGGVKEKVIAAHRAGAVEILLPEDNMKDIDELPANVRNSLTFKPLKTIDDVFEEVLVKKQDS